MPCFALPCLALTRLDLPIARCSPLPVTPCPTRDPLLAGQHIPSLLILSAGGKLATVFSAPEYPYLCSPGEERLHGKGAVAVLSAPDWATPRFVQFEAALPRLEVGAA